MTFEEAIKTAIEYEIKVRDTYLNSLNSIKDEMGKRVFKVLGDEEQGHVDFLECKLGEWKKTGTVSSSDLKTVVPSFEKIEKGVKQLDNHLTENQFETELEMLKKALVMEQETSDFYRKMVDELDSNGDFFKPFLEIEDGHTAIVQAEINYLTKTGSFFNFEEFGQEY
ncbi:MAG: hypothetical protein GY865_03610 [candidate division Zixibacteria bacterium]|nr:hypothetical protein [candidate division Zixibacteria bacterium]